MYMCLIVCVCVCNGGFTAFYQSCHRETLSKILRLYYNYRKVSFQEIIMSIKFPLCVPWDIPCYIYLYVY